MNEDGDDSGKWCSEQGHADIMDGDGDGEDSGKWCSEQGHADIMNEDGDDHTCDISLFRRELPIFFPFLRKSPYLEFQNFPI